MEPSIVDDPSAMPCQGHVRVTYGCSFVSYIVMISAPPSTKSFLARLPPPGHSAGAGGRAGPTGEQIYDRGLSGLFGFVRLQMQVWLKQK